MWLCWWKKRLGHNLAQNDSECGIRNSRYRKNFAWISRVIIRFKIQLCRRTCRFPLWVVARNFARFVRDAFENGTRGCFISVLHMEPRAAPGARKTEYPSRGVSERSPERGICLKTGPVSLKEALLWKMWLWEALRGFKASTCEAVTSQTPRRRRHCTRRRQARRSSGKRATQRDSHD